MKANQEVWRLGDLMALRDDRSSNQPGVQNVIIAGEETEGFLLEHLIKKYNPAIKVLRVAHSEDLLGLLNLYIPDLLLLDLKMPCKKGVKCLGVIRGNPLYNDLPIVAFSSLNRPSNEKMALELGANAYFRKPEDESLLESTIIGILSRQWAK